MTIRSAATPNYGGRKLVDLLMRGLTIVATSMAIVPLVLIIGYVLVEGGRSLSVEFFTSTYKPVLTLDGGVGIDPITGLPSDGAVDPITGLPVEAGIDPLTGLPLPTPVPGSEPAPAAEPAPPETGGVLHGMVGTLLITGAALLLSLPIGVLAGVFLSEYPANPLATFVRFCSDVLSGAPSIIVGVVGYVLLVQRFGTYSGLAGAVALTFLMVPTITRTTEEILKLVPNATREAALAMGAPMWYATFTVVIPTALSGIITGVMLAFARGAGETAPLLLTVGGNNELSYNLLQPIAALPLLTYNYTGSPFPSEFQLAWGTAFVLTMLVLIVNILVRFATRSRLK